MKAMIKSCASVLVSLGAGLTLSTAKEVERFDGPPVTTALSWAIADLHSNKILWSKDAETPRKAASTTKIMAACVVLKLADKNPSILEEWIEVSELAAKTGGSSADLNAGEKVQVQDALFALMLPSGNDMGNAIAEHFAPRLDPPDEDTPERVSREVYATRANFIAEMNREAKQLGLEQTQYFIPYGDGGGSDSRTTTVADLIKLTHHALQNPIFRRIVATAEYQANVLDPEGTPREAIWMNTNQLLGYENYRGVKTGTTRTAGSCLVSYGVHQDRHLIMVILGARGNQGRYTDTRNLFRWAIQTLSQSKDQ